jgi:hypothetical protein
MYGHRQRAPPVCEVPKPYRPVATPGGKQRSSIDGNGAHGMNPASVAFQDVDLDAGIGVPDPYRLVTAAGGEQGSAIDGDGADVLNLALMALDGP